MSRARGAGAVAAAIVLLSGAACLGPAGSSRTETFEVDGAREAFTLTVAEVGRGALRIEGDARGTPLRVSGRGAVPGGMSPESGRRDLLRYLDAHIERLAPVPAAAEDVQWLRRFRSAYEATARAGRAR